MATKTLEQQAEELQAKLAEVQSKQDQAARAEAQRIAEAKARRAEANKARAAEAQETDLPALAKKRKALLADFDAAVIDGDGAALVPIYLQLAQTVAEQQAVAAKINEAFLDDRKAERDRLEAAHAELAKLWPFDAYSLGQSAEYRAKSVREVNAKGRELFGKDWDEVTDIGQAPPIPRRLREVRGDHKAPQSIQPLATLPELVADALGRAASVWQDRVANAWDAGVDKQAAS